MRIWSLFMLAAFFPWFVSGPASAGNSDTQVVSVQTSSINDFSLSTGGAPITLDVNAATAGNEPFPSYELTGTYAITTNVTAPATKKITAVLDSNTPTNTTLSVWMLGGIFGTSAGPVFLSTTVKDMVTGIDAAAAPATGVWYNFTATVAAGVVSSTPRTVTYTLTDT